MSRYQHLFFALPTAPALPVAHDDEILCDVVGYVTRLGLLVPRRARRVPRIEQRDTLEGTLTHDQEVLVAVVSNNFPGPLTFFAAGHQLPDSLRVGDWVRAVAVRCELDRQPNPTPAAAGIHLAVDLIHLDPTTDPATDRLPPVGD